MPLLVPVTARGLQSAKLFRRSRVKLLRSRCDNSSSAPPDRRSGPLNREKEKASAYDDCGHLRRQAQRECEVHQHNDRGSNHVKQIARAVFNLVHRSRQGEREVRRPHTGEGEPFRAGDRCVQSSSERE